MNVVITKILKENEIKSNIWSGLTFSIMIGAVAWALGIFLPSLGAVNIALILGFTIGNLFVLPKAWETGIKFSEKKVLEKAIILMGVGLNFTVFQALGWNLIVLLIFMVGGTTFLGFLLGKWLSNNASLGGLVGVGTAVCGSSAIAAAAPVVSEKQEEIALSVGVVNLLGTIGIFALPALVQIFQLPSHSASVFIGGALQAVGQVVASGFILGETVGEGAVLVKMLRVALLVPVILVLQFALNKKSTKQNKGKLIPFFLIGFILMAILNSLGVFPENVASGIKLFSKILLVIALAAIGLNIRFNTLRKKGFKALLMGIILFVVQLVFLLITIPLMENFV